MADEDPLAWVEAIDVEVDVPTLENYLEAIGQIQRRDLTRADGNLFRGIPVTTKTAGWRRINLLHTGRPTVSLLIDEVDCYLVAINPGDGRGWMKCTDRDVPESAQASSMGLPSSYTVLRKDIDREELVFGLPILTHAYYTLSAFDPNLSPKHPKMKKQRKVLLQMAMMFCEVIRFKHILDKIKQIMADEGSTGTLNTMEWEWVQNWSTISKFALVSKALEERHVMLDAPEEVAKVVGFGINNRDEVAALLGLILKS